MQHFLYTLNVFITSITTRVLWVIKWCLAQRCTDSSLPLWLRILWVHKLCTLCSSPLKGHTRDSCRKKHSGWIRSAISLSFFFIILSSMPLTSFVFSTTSFLVSPLASFQTLYSSIPHIHTITLLPLPSNISFSQINLFASFSSSFICVSVSLVHSLLREANLVSTKCTMFHSLLLIAVVLLMSVEWGNHF